MALPVLAATLTTVVVFFPVTFLYGVSRFLFTALALAVVLSLFASYFVAMTVVPLFCAKLHQGPSSHTGSRHAQSDGMGPAVQRLVQPQVHQHARPLRRPAELVAGPARWRPSLGITACSC